MVALSFKQPQKRKRVLEAHGKHQKLGLFPLQFCLRLLLGMPTNDSVLIYYRNFQREQEHTPTIGAHYLTVPKLLTHARNSSSPLLICVNSSEGLTTLTSAGVQTPVSLSHFPPYRLRITAVRFTLIVGGTVS